MPVISFSSGVTFFFREIRQRVLTEVSGSEKRGRVLLEACLAENVKNEWEKA
jgi:hypothetical protein